MKIQETAVMLEYLKAHEPYLDISEIQVTAWQETLLPTIEAKWCREFIADYYSQPERDRLTAGEINYRWRKHLSNREVAGNQQGRSCGQSECRCTHTACEYGFMRSVSVEDAVTPCPQCKGETLVVLRELPDPGKRESWQMSAVAEHYRRKAKA